MKKLIIVLIAIYFTACSKHSQVVFELIDPFGLSIDNAIIALSPHNEELANDYQESSLGSFVTFTDISKGSYKLSIDHEFYTLYIMDPFIIKRNKLKRKVNMEPLLSKITISTIPQIGVINKATISLTLQNGNENTVYEKTAFQGKATFIDIPAGNYDISASHHRYSYIPHFSSFSLKTNVHLNLFFSPDTISFANQNWFVLDEQETQILIISEKSIGERIYDSSSNNWENSEIRAFLNDSYYNSFPEQEKEKIVETEIRTGYINTIDHIFLLNAHEVFTYFTSEFPEEIYTWWERTSSDFTPNASVIYIDGNNLRNISVRANSFAGVRPVMWIRV